MIKARCTINDLDQLPDGATKNRLQQYIRISGEIQDLALGEAYPVWAIARWDDGGIRIYIHSVRDHWWPTPYPAEFFDFVETSLPNDWALSFATVEDDIVVRCISFPEWAHDEHFYERLVDGDRQTIEIYERRRLEVDLA